MSTPDRSTEDDDIEGTSAFATPAEDVLNAREEGEASDIVGGDSAPHSTVDGAYGDGGDYDEAMAPVIEAGGGVAEGFEQSEAALVSNAEDSLGSTRDITFDAIDEESGADEDAEFGEADSVKESSDDE
jgi:hypothetical protein